MPTPAGRRCAIKFRGKVFVGEHHKDAIDLAFKGFSDLTVHKVSQRIVDGKEKLLFGYAYEDGSKFILADSQAGRLLMYGFE